jgi:hypothetical protein
MGIRTPFVEHPEIPEPHPSVLLAIAAALLAAGYPKGTKN